MKLNQNKHFFIYKELIFESKVVKLALNSPKMATMVIFVTRLRGRKFIFGNFYDQYQKNTYLKYTFKQKMVDIFLVEEPPLPYRLNNLSRKKMACWVISHIPLTLRKKSFVSKLAFNWVVFLNIYFKKQLHVGRNIYPSSKYLVHTKRRKKLKSSPR